MVQANTVLTIPEMKKGQRKAQFFVKCVLLQYRLYVCAVQFQRAGFLMVMHLFSVILLQFFSRPCNGLSMHIFAYSSSSFWVKA